MLLFGCKEKNTGVEVVPNLESIYLSDKVVDVQPNETNDLKLNTNKELISFADSFAAKVNRKPELFRIRIRLFINDKGSIDKIMDIGTSAGSLDSLGNMHNTVNVNQFINELAPILNDWKFTPALKNGQPTNCWEDMKLDLQIQPNASYRIEPPNFLSGMPNMNDFVQVDKFPQVISSGAPKYPEQAKQAGIEGTAYVKLLVNTDGVPAKAVVIKSDNEVFNQPSIDAAMQFKFTPALKDNKPVAIWVVIPFKYKLSDSEGKLMKKEDLKKINPKKIKGNN